MIGIKTFLRHLSRNKMYTAVILGGFSLSLTFVVLLGLYIKNETSVDNFHKNGDRIYRLEHESVDFSAPIAVDLKREYNEIETFTRVLNSSGRISAPGSQKIKFDYLGVDPDFFGMFSFELLKGRAEEVLQTEDGIVLSRALANRLFGSLEVLGETVLIGGDHKFTVRGIMEDFPDNTHFTPQGALVNLRALKRLWGFEAIMEEYGFCSMSIYFMSRPNADLPSKAPQILDHFKENFWLYKEGWAKTVEFTPLKELYFSTKVGHGNKSSSKTLILVLAFIVMLILVLAVGNYINLTMAQAGIRAKEVSMKKLLGGSRGQLMLQLVGESFLLCLSAFLIAFLLAKILESPLESFLGSPLDLQGALTPANMLLVLVAAMGISFVSGIVPAWKISRLKPLEVIQGEVSNRTKNVYSKIFITFQYTVAIALLSSSWIILKQTDYLRNKELGFDKDHIVYMEYLGRTDQKKAIKEELGKIPGVREVSVMWQSPLSGGSNITFETLGKSVSFQEMTADSSFFKLFSIEVTPTPAAYSPEGVILNEAALKVLELGDNPVSFKMEDTEVPILGIVKDFHFKQLYDKIGPLAIRQQTEGFNADQVFIKVDPKGMERSLEQIKTVYGNLVGDVQFELGFVDQTMEQWYEREERTGKILGYFTILAVVISSMGILAMATFYMQQRRKEIAIRKVNGAGIGTVLLLLNRDFVKWVGLAFVIAVPISWYAMHSWLEGFAYRTEIGPLAFVLAGAFTLMVALLTVSWQSYKAARTNPVDALRSQ